MRQEINGPVADQQHKYLTMTTDLYHHIYNGEIFQKTCCIEQENNLVDFFRNTLTNLGYHSVDSSRKVWQRGDRTVVVCLVDDVSTCSESVVSLTPYQFDASTVVITDNRINCPTQYRVLQLPSSFFGIYSYTPELSEWTPEKRFGLSVNRIDQKRLLLLLELAFYMPRVSDDKILADFEYDNVNFNCWSWTGDNTTADGLRDNFVRLYAELPDDQQEHYRDFYNELLKKMPIKNYIDSPELIMTKNWLNLIVETYSGPETVALSEKIFRALVTPAPWAALSGRYSVAYLTELGFDVLDDLVDHRYDYCETSSTEIVDNKIVDIMNVAKDTVARLQQQDLAKLQARCKQAAQHNQALLATMKQQWPRDFAAWLPSVISELSK